MKKLLKRIILGIILLLTLLIAGLYFYGPQFNLYLIPPKPQQYAEIALDKMDDVGIFTDSKKWEIEKKATLKEVKHAQTYEETLPYLEAALTVAGGKHSFIVKSNAESEQNETSEYIEPYAEIKDGLLFLTVPKFSGNQEQAITYANSIESALHTNDYQAIIVDLRQNTGGDMTPMILGLSPIIPDGVLFTYVDKQGAELPVTLKEGTLDSGNSPITLKNHTKVKEVPIALLIDHQTGSSGELTTLCFKDLPNVTLFGEDSAGYTSANQEIYLYDGTIMQVTNAFIKDRAGTLYKNEPIQPDVLAKDSQQSAKDWLKKNK